MTDADNKRRIIQRISDYRKAHGLGCLEAVAKATNTHGRISGSDIHEMMMGGGPKRLMRDWRTVDRALDRLEGKT